LSVIFYEYDTRSLNFREERRLRAFENRVLRRIFVPKKDEVIGKWRKLHNDELNDLYSSSNIFRAIKSRRMRWVGHVARMGEMHTGFWWGNLREKAHLENQGVNGRIIVRWIFRKWGGGA
jgi:hypothetical protein